MVLCRCALLIFAAAFAAGIGACRPATQAAPRKSTPSPDPVRVVASTPIIAELVARVGGPWVDIEVLVPVDQSPSSLQRTGPNETKLVAADLVVILGFDQEAPLAPSLAHAAAAGTVICEIAATLPTELLLPHVDNPTQFDPHIWLDPKTWAEATRPIEAALTSVRPELTKEWRDQAHTTRFQLEETSRSLTRLVATGLPPDSQPLQTTQPALRYLARAVGLPLELLSTPEDHPKRTALDSLPLDVLRTPGLKQVASIHEHDLGTVDGLRAYALDLMLQQNP